MADDTPKVPEPYVKIDIAKALSMRLMDRMSIADIAAHFECSESGVYKALGRFKGFLDDAEGLEAYKQHKAQIYTQLERVAVEMLLNDLVQGKGSLKDKAYCLDILTKNVRLLSGESTSNVSLLVSTLERVHKRGVTIECTEVNGDVQKSTPVQ